VSPGPPSTADPSSTTNSTALVGSKRLGMIHDMMHGNDDHEGIIQAIPKAKAKDSVEVIRYGMYKKEIDRIDNTDKENSPGLGLNSNRLGGFSIADELTKLVKLKEQGALDKEEFDCLKKNLLDKKVE
jgi:hypothetical protein